MIVEHRLAREASPESGAVFFSAYKMDSLRYHTSHRSGCWPRATRGESVVCQSAHPPVALDVTIETSVKQVCIDPYRPHIDNISTPYQPHIGPRWTPDRP